MKNKAKLIEVVKSDCEVRYTYKSKKTGQTCIIGALAEDCGLDLSAMGLDSEALHTPFVDTMVELYQPIEAKYGLSPSQQRAIQEWNDAYDTQQKRQDAILNYIESLPDYQ